MKDLDLVFAYKDLDYSSGCDIISCDMCGKKMIVPLWALGCPECGYIGIDGIEGGVTLEDIQKRYIVVWKDCANKFKSIKTNRQLR